MENVKNIMPMALLCVFVGKLVIFGVSAPECGVALGLISLLCVKEYLGFKRNIKMQELIDNYNKQNEVIAKMATEIDNLKTSWLVLKCLPASK